MLIKGTAQEEILSMIKRDSESLDNEIITTIMEEWLPRRDQMIGLYNRSILASTDSTYKQGGTVDDGKFKRSIDYNGIPIFKLELANKNNVNKPVHHDFLNEIKTNFQDYMTGNPIMVVYDSGDETQDEEKTIAINEWIRKESLQGKWSKVAGDDAQAGTGHLMLYQDGENLHCKALEAHEAIVVYDTNGDPQIAIRMWDGQEKTISDASKVETIDYVYVEYYDDTTIKFYKAPGRLSSTSIGAFMPWYRKFDSSAEEVTEILHTFNGVPIIEYPKDVTRVGEVEKSLDLQDLYDLLDTGLNNEILQQAMAYLVVKSNGLNIDDEFKQTLISTGIFALDAEGEIYFVEKNLNDDALSKSMDRVEKAIYKKSNSIDYATLEGDTRIMGLEQKLKKIDSSVTKTIRAWEVPMQYFWSLVFGYWNEFEGGDYDSSYVDVVYTKNKPRDVFAELTAFVQAGGRISNKTMLEQLSFIKDTQKEQARIDDENSTLSSEMAIGDDILTDSVTDIDEAVEVAKLSGIQITSANDIIGSVARGEITREAGINQLKVFLGLTDQQANQVMGKQTSKKVDEIEAK
jgi:SPP1 family phage portal protein